MAGIPATTCTGIYRVWQMKRITAAQGLQLILGTGVEILSAKLRESRLDLGTFTSCARRTRWLPAYCGGSAAKAPTADAGIPIDSAGSMAGPATAWTH